MHPHRILQSALVLVLIALPLACGDEGDSADGSTTTAVTTTVAGEGGSTSTEAPSSQLVLWPLPSGSVTYDDPVAAATGFATELVGFTDPVVGEFQQGDSRSGEVEIRPTEDGPVTTVMVRQVGSDDTWSVIAAATANIVVTQPDAAATVTSPLELKGTATAFEGTVQVTVRDDTDSAPLLEGFVTGGSMGEMGPFEGNLDFTRPASDAGSVILYTTSMEDGRVWEAAVFPVEFG